MIRPRIIPALLLRDQGLVKGNNFSKHKYVGDPINAVRIFSKMEVDELFFLDIESTNKSSIISLELIQDIADECFMPFGVGGGIKNLDEIKSILKGGAEKVVINTAAYENPNLIKEASSYFGKQAIVVSIDYKVVNGKPIIFTNSGKKPRTLDLFDYVKLVEEEGAGEILITSIDREGDLGGFELEISKKVCEITKIPVIVHGGAWTIEDIFEIFKVNQPSAVAAGSMFVFKGSRDGVLINYPSRKILETLFKKLDSYL